MDKRQIAYYMIGAGALVQVLESLMTTEAQVNNTTFDTTTFGKVVAPIDKMLPIPLGYSLIVVGALLLVIPL